MHQVSDPSSSLYQYLSPTNRPLIPEENNAELKFHEEQKFPQDLKDSQTKKFKQKQKSKKLGQKHRSRQHSLKLIEMYQRPDSHSKIYEEFSPEEQALNKITSLIQAFQCEGNYAELQEMREAKRQLFLLNKHFNKIENKSQSQIRTLKLAEANLKSKMDTITSVPEVRASIALENLIAKKKGIKTRDVIVTSRQMHSMLEKRLPEYEKHLWNISKVLARQINEIMEEPDKYRGKNLQLKAGDKEYFFASDDGYVDALSIKLFLWLEVAPDGSKIELFIVPPDLKPIGSGTNKEAYEAHCLEIPFKTNPSPTELKFPGKPSIFIYDRDCSYTPKVLIKIAEYPGQEALEAQKRGQIEREIHVQKSLHQYVPENLLVAPIKTTYPKVPGTENTSLYSQKRYLSDLEVAISKEKIPTDFSKSPKYRSLDTQDFLKIIKDVALSLQGFHNSKFIHQDVKPKNIYVELCEDEKTLKGVLADYDLTQESGIKFFHCLENNYWYWDSLCNKNLTTYFTDVYALTKCLVQAIVPRWDTAFAKPPILAEDQESLLLEDIKNMFPTLELPQNCSKTVMIMLAEELLKNTIKTEKKPRKLKFQETLIKIRAIREVLKLFARVALIDKELAKIQLPSEFVWKLVQSNSNFSSTDRNECLLQEINAYFNLKDSVFFTHIISAIPYYDQQTSSSKIQNIRIELKLKLASSSLDPLIHSELEGIAQKIEGRINALEFMQYLNKTKKHIKERQPLYLALVNPAILMSDEMVYDFINLQISTIVHSKNNYEYLDILKVCEDIKEPNEKRKTLKDMLENRIRVLSPCVIRSELQKILNQIVMLESAMDFAIEIRNGYKAKVNEVKKKAMTIETFIENLNEIIESLRSCEEEEKN